MTEVSESVLVCSRVKMHRTTFNLTAGGLDLSRPVAAAEVQPVRMEPMNLLWTEFTLTFHFARRRDTALSVC